jgi:hypothetical protein
LQGRHAKDAGEQFLQLGNCCRGRTGRRRAGNQRGQRFPLTLLRHNTYCRLHGNATMCCWRLRMLLHPKNSGAKVLLSQVRQPYSRSRHARTSSRTSAAYAAPWWRRRTRRDDPVRRQWAQHPVGGRCLIASLLSQFAPATPTARTRPPVHSTTLNALAFTMLLPRAAVYFPRSEADGSVTCRKGPRRAGTGRSQRTKPAFSERLPDQLDHRAASCARRSPSARQRLLRGPRASSRPSLAVPRRAETRAAGDFLRRVLRRGVAAEKAGAVGAPGAGQNRPGRGLRGAVE